MVFKYESEYIMLSVVQNMTEVIELHFSKKKY